MLATFRPSRDVKMDWRVADMTATSRACRARGIWGTTRHMDKRAALHCGRPPADQSGKRVATRKLLPWNIGCTQRSKC